jgi:hypothetical protein
MPRAYRQGDLVHVEHRDKTMFISCPTGRAVVMRASGWHCHSLQSIGGSLPDEFDPYYQILKVLSAGRSYYNVHSHNVKLLSGNEES